MAEVTNQQLKDLDDSMRKAAEKGWEDIQRRRAEKAQHRFRPCEKCGGSPDIHNTNRGALFVGHEYA